MIAERDAGCERRERRCFFFQAEDGIRDLTVTGVQTCALPISFEAVDVLFIDEAGQTGLADVLAVSQAAKSLVLIGDPQQLERPLKGSHPDGAEKSALEHLLGDHKTIPPDMGFLLPRTWRFDPKICQFTSEHFCVERLAVEVVT